MAGRSKTQDDEVLGWRALFSLTGVILKALTGVILKADRGNFGGFDRGNFECSDRGNSGGSLTEVILKAV